MTTYYAKASATGGGVGSLADPFTLQEAADTATSADLVLVCADGTYTPSTTIDFDARANLGVFRGCNSDGTDDGTVATISGSSLPATTDLLNVNIGNSFVSFQNLRITGATRYNLLINTFAVQVVLENCRVDSSTSHGVYLNNGATKAQLCGCEIDSNSGNGIGTSQVYNGEVILNRCTVHDNTSAGGAFGSGCVSDCLIYGNGNDGLQAGASYAYGRPGLVVSGTTFFNNSGDGLYVLINGHGVVENCIFRSNGEYGISVNGGSGNVNQLVLRNICSHNNTSGHTDINSGTLWGSGHVLEDPGFTSETDGSEDLTPSNANLYKTLAFPAGGTSYEYIGAIQPQATGGGGYTYGDEDPDLVLTTATGAGNYVPIADSDTVDGGVSYGAGEEGTGVNSTTLGTILDARGVTTSNVPLTSTIAGRIDAAVSSRAAPGNQMDLIDAPNATALTAIGARLEAMILDEGDATALLAAIAAKVEEFLINDGDASATLAAIAAAVRTNLTTELGRIDAAVSSRAASGEAATAVAGLNDLDAAGIRAALGMAAADLDTQIGLLSTLTAEQVNAEVLDVVATDQLIDTKTLQQAIRYIAAVCAGLLSGAGTGTETAKGLDKVTDRARFTVDENGNRTAVDYD